MKDGYIQFKIEELVQKYEQLQHQINLLEIDLKQCNNTQKQCDKQIKRAVTIPEDFYEELTKKGIDKLDYEFSKKLNPILVDMKHYTNDIQNNHLKIHREERESIRKILHNYRIGINHTNDQFERLCAILNKKFPEKKFNELKFVRIQVGME